MKKAIIIASMDNYANGVKPRHLKNHLEQRGFKVALLESAHRKSLKGFLSNLVHARNPFMYTCMAVLMTIAKKSKSDHLLKYVTSFFSVRAFEIYGEITSKRLRQSNADLVICESGLDIGFVAYDKTDAIKILDLPCPLAEEMYFGDMITERSYRRLVGKEISYYKAADALSFHWHTYNDYVRRKKYDGDNIINMGYGTIKKDLTAMYSEEPKVIFLGLLNGYWVNLPLLEEIVKICPNVDVYGGPKPPAHIKVNYKGYAPTLDVMAEYQFGLITISKDELRKSSFSSKHLEYISYGLPVLTPEWREDNVLRPSSIYYKDAEDLKRKIAMYSDKVSWNKIHLESINLADELSWYNSFKKLDLLLESHAL